MRKEALLIAGVVGAGVAAFMGLGHEDEPPEEPRAEQASSAKPPPGHAAAPTKSRKTGGGIAGEVAETIDVKGYTYLRLKTAKGEVWAAVPSAKLAVGDQARVVNATEMAKFRSETLDRTFDLIYFGSLASGTGAGQPPPGHPPTGKLPAGHSAPAASANPSLRPEVSRGRPEATHTDVGKVAPATGDDARNVAQIVAQRKELSGKRIVVRGVVVKATLSVMGRNWLHVQDGTGDPAKGDHDLVVTTQGSAKVGQTVLVTGKVLADKDFGAGYRYDVLVEEAEIKVESGG